MIPAFDPGELVVIRRHTPSISGIYSIVRALARDDKHVRYIVKHEIAGFVRVVDEAHLQAAAARKSVRGEG